MHGGAVEADLLRYYQTDIRDLGRSLSHRRMLVLIRHLPAEAATVRAVAGPMADWDLPTQLLAMAANELRVQTWMNTKDAAAKPPRNYPTPILPPSVEVKDDNKQVEKFGTTVMTIEETNEWLGW